MSKFFQFKFFLIKKISVFLNKGFSLREWINFDLPEKKEEFFKYWKFQTINWALDNIYAVVQSFVEHVFELRMRDSYTNPSETKRIESFEIFGLRNQIHNTNLSKTGLRNESTIRIFQKQVYEMNPQYKSFKNRSTKRIRNTNP